MTTGPASTTGQNKRLRGCFVRGEQRAAAQDHDYAHLMFAECVAGDPGNLEYVEAMLQNLRARAAGAKKKPRGRLSKPLRTAVQQEQWAEVLRLGVAVLADNPWQVATLHAMAQACEALHYNEVELAYLKEALDANPKDVEVNRHCGRSLARMGQFDQAIACWHRVEQLAGGDAEATQMISHLAEEKLRYPGGRPPTTDATPPVAMEDSADEAPDEIEYEAVQAPPEIPRSPQQKLEDAIREDPANVGNYLRLAELCCELGNYDRAERVLADAEENCAQKSRIDQARQTVHDQRTEAAQQAAREEQQKKQRAEGVGSRVPVLETILAAAVVGLVLQLVPGLWSSVATFMGGNVRGMLMLLNIAILAGLIWWQQRAKE